MNKKKICIIGQLSLVVLATIIFINNGYAKDVNAFNRLFVPPKERDSKLENDGIHDPSVPSLKLLQQPGEALRILSSGAAGNNVDWVKSQKKRLISPRFDLHKPDAKAMVMDLSIVMEVKGSMPDVKYPHQPHTAILDCSNCHDKIFKPLKGGNSMSMAEIMLGQKCGVCHGSVAFPVTECLRCHSVSKKAKKSKKK